MRGPLANTSYGIADDCFALSVVSTIFEMTLSFSDWICLRQLSA